MDKIKLIIADDHKIFLDGIKSLLSEIEKFEIIATASSGEQLIELLKFNTPDIVITDITMKGINGIEVTRIITELYPTIKVLILSMHSTEEFVLNAAKVGADGYLPKDSSIEELIEAIETINEGNQFYAKNVRDYFLNHYIKRFRVEQDIIEKSDLTSREMEILKLVATGLTNKEIADKLIISQRTVDAHKNHIMQKLKLKSSAEMIIYAIKNKLVEV